jgi:hypothetical protein
MQCYSKAYLFIAVVVLICSCNKKQSAILINPGGINQPVLSNIDTISPNASILGRWSLILDSFFLAESPPFFNGGDSLYFGASADYYDFGADSNLYRREGPHTDTCLFAVMPKYQLNFPNILDYQIAKDSLQYLITPRVNKFYTITTLTDHYLTLEPVYTSTILTPEGYLANKIRLEK